MRYPGATWLPGPAYKVNSAPLAPKGIVAHSMVGYKGGAHAVLFDQGQQYRASWHFSVYQDGSVEQHYDTEVQTWHAQAANAFAIGIEHEGGYNPEDEPLTPRQRNASVALVQWLSMQYGFPLERHNGLWEHNEFAEKPCPSNRIPWEFYVAQTPTVPEDDDMLTQDQFNDMLKTAIGLPGGYQATVEEFDNELFADIVDLKRRMEAVEAGVAPADVDVSALEAKYEEIKKRLDAAKIVI